MLCCMWIEAEGDANQIMRDAGLFPEEPAHPRTVAAKLGVEVERVRHARLAFRREADLAWVNGSWKILIYEKMTAAREGWIVGHELGHWYLRTRGIYCEQEEARCDAIGACLVAPKPAFLVAVGALGHRVHELADIFSTTQSLALLRLGETTGRPVLLFRKPSAIVRGEPFEWGDDPRKIPRSIAHPIKVDDGWGMMAERYTSAA